MDYSLLLNVESVSPDSVDESWATRNIFLSKDQTEVYHIGIIDYLQTYNFQKRFERFAKSAWCERRTNSDQQSSIPPEPYAKRFIEFMQLKVFWCNYDDTELEYISTLFNSAYSLQTQITSSKKCRKI